MLDRFGGALLPPVSMIQHYSTYTRVPGSVSIQKIRSVPYGYGELLALLVYLTDERTKKKMCKILLVFSCL